MAHKTFTIVANSIAEYRTKKFGESHEAAKLYDVLDRNILISRMQRETGNAYTAQFLKPFRPCR